MHKLPINGNVDFELCIIVIHRTGRNETQKGGSIAGTALIENINQFAYLSNTRRVERLSLRVSIRAKYTPLGRSFA
jgi:hypothetical protein